MPQQPVNVENAVRLANEYLRSGRLAEAESIYQQVLAENHDHFVALHGLGVIAMNMGNLSRAAELISCAIEQNPFDCAAHNNLGITLMKQARLNEAVQSFNKSLSINPDYASAMYNLARTHQELGNHGAGLEIMLKARGYVRFTLGKVMLLSATQREQGKDNISPKAA